MKNLLTGLAIGMMAGGMVCSCCPKVRNMMEEAKQKLKKSNCCCGENTVAENCSTSDQNE